MSMEYVGTVDDTSATPEYQPAIAEAAVERGPSKLKVVVRWIAYVALALVPLWYSSATYDVLDFNKQVLLTITASIGLLLFFFDVIRSGTLEYRFGRLLWIIAGFLIAGLISTFTSVSLFTSVFGSGNSRGTSLIFWASLLILAFLAASTTVDQGKKLRSFMTISLGLTFILGLLQILGAGIFSGSYASRAFNTVGSANGLAVLAAATLPMFLNIFSWNGRWFEIVTAIFRVVGLASAILLLAILNQPFIWIIAIVGLVAFIGLRSINQPGAFRLKIFALPLSIIVLGIFLMLVKFDWTDVRSKLPVEVWLSHSASWQIAQNAMGQKIMGYGPENYGIAFDQLRPAELSNTIFFRNRFFDGRSEFYSLLTEGGVVIIFALAYLLFSVLWQSIRIVRDRASYQGAIIMMWPVVIALTVTLFLYPFNITLFAIFAIALVVVTLLKPGMQEAKVINLEQSGGLSLIGSLGFVVGLVAVLFAMYFTANNFQSSRQLALAANGKDSDAMILHYGYAINANNRDSRLYQMMSQTLMDRVAKEIKAGPQKDESKEAYGSRVGYYIDSAIDIAKKATQLEPEDSENWLNLGYMYQNIIGLRQDADSYAVANYQESIKRNPASTIAYARIGATYLTLADFAASNKAKPEVVQANLSKAEDALLKATKLSQTYGLANYNLAVVYERQGRLADAIKQFEKLQASDPRNAGLPFQLGLLHYRNNEKDLAVKDWQQAIALFPNYANARWYLSLALEEQGKIQEALDQVKEIEKTNPDNALVKQRIEQLSAGIQKFPPQNVLDEKPLN